MYQLILKHLFIGVIALLAVTSCNDQNMVQNTPPPADSQEKLQKTRGDGGEVIPGEYIVVFKDQWEGRINNEVAQEALQFVNNKIETFGIKEQNVKSRYEYALRGFAATLTEAQLEAIKKNPQVDFVEQNQRFNGIEGTTSMATTPAVVWKNTLMSQTTPWGITRVGGAQNGSGKKAWVLDTGIDLDHPDLNVDVGNSVSFVGGESADDLNGHGTHVAGTIAAINNSTDVVGVAAGATVVSVKVLDQNGIGTIEDVVDGVNYVAGRASSSHIINMSLGLYNPSGSVTSIDYAVNNVANSGLRFTIAAGNDGVDANYQTPARVENSNVWTVSAYDDNDAFVTAFTCNPNYGSNYGNPPIEYGGPGDNVTSLKPGGGTAVKCGTSMAAPHIAGLLLTVPNKISTDGYVSNDPDNSPDPIAAYTPLRVYITGPIIPDSDESGIWTAHPQYGSGSYTYQWYFKNIAQASWVAAGTSQSYSRSFDNQGASPGTAQLKVVVNSGSDQAEKTHYITIFGAGCPPGQICL